MNGLLERACWQPGCAAWGAFGWRDVAGTQRFACRPHLPREYAQHLDIVNGRATARPAPDVAPGVIQPKQGVLF